MHSAIVFYETHLAGPEESGYDFKNWDLGPEVHAWNQGLLTWYYILCVQNTGFPELQIYLFLAFVAESLRNNSFSADFEF